MTTITPPPVQPPAQPPLAGPPPAQTAGSPHPVARVVAILVIVLGALMIAGAATTAIIGGVAAASVHTETRTLALDDLDALDVDVSAGDVQVEFGDVDDATLQVTSTLGADRWQLDSDGSTLVVSTPHGFLGLAWVFGGNGRAVLTLPDRFEGRIIDGELDLSAGELTVAGTFGDLDATVSAGSLEVDGAASNLDVDVSAGSARFELDAVREADLTVSAGELLVSVADRAPRLVSLDVSAGSLELTVPDDTYDVQIDVSAGELRNHLDTASGADNVITGQISAGEAVLRASR